MKGNKYKKRKIYFFIIGFLLIGFECILRFAFGFCDALLFENSDAYEYIAQPNQDRYRFGAHIHYNSYSQRNKEPDSTKIKILGLGDSVIFGGTMLDQDAIATTLFSKKTGWQMLNISAGSWGPDNCAAYLKEKGTFEAKAMILVCSSHDAYDTMTYTPVAGVYPNYPDRQYKVALWELLDRYFWPWIVHSLHQTEMKIDPDAATVQHVPNGAVAKKSSFFNPGFDELKAIADSAHIPFAIFLHAEKGEIEAKQYNEMGKKIIAWAKTTDTPLMQGLTNGESIDMYRDVIHLNERGQRHLARCLENFKIIN